MVSKPRALSKPSGRCSLSKAERLWQNGESAVLFPKEIQTVSRTQNQPENKRDPSPSPKPHLPSQQTPSGGTCTNLQPLQTKNQPGLCPAHLVLVIFDICLGLILFKTLCHQLNAPELKNMNLLGSLQNLKTPKMPPNTQQITPEASSAIGKPVPVIQCHNVGFVQLKEHKTPQLHDVHSLPVFCCSQTRWTNGS